MAADDAKEAGEEGTRIPNVRMIPLDEKRRKQLTGLEVLPVFANPEKIAADTHDGDDEINLNAFMCDPWDLDEDFFYQQQTRSGACNGVGVLIVGKPGAGKATLAAKLAEKLGAVHVGLPQILAQAMDSYTEYSRIEELDAEIK
eukprot:1524158-Rhodomonas_salina.5